MQYRIGEFAKLGGVSIKTLRYYDQIGLLQPAAVDPRTQYRLYIPDQLRELATILALKELGASLQEVRRLFRRGESRRERLELLTKLKRHAESSITAATRSLLWIEGALQEMGDGRRDVSVVLKRRTQLRVASLRAQANTYDEIGQLERDLHKAVESQLSRTSAVCFGIVVLPQASSRESHSLKCRLARNVAAHTTSKSCHQ